MDEPVENASASRTKPNRGFDHHVSSSASRERWTIASAAAAANSTTKSRSLGIHRVCRCPIEPKLQGGGFAVERIPGPGDRARAERRDIRPAATVGQAPAIAFEHLDIREEVMGEQDGLGRLDVRRPRQDGAAFTLGQSNERALELDDRPVESIDRPPQPQPKVGRDLVVARPARMEPVGQGPIRSGARPPG